MIDQSIARQQVALSHIYRPVEWRQPLAVAIVALLIAFARMPDRMINGFLWGEDGKIFLADAYNLGIGSIFNPYAQYLHVIPRLIALAFSEIGRIDHAARPLMWVAALVLASTCAYLFTFARKTLPLGAAWAFGLTPILIPSSGEVWLTITNIQWVIAPALLVLLWDEFCSPSASMSRISGDIVRGTAITLMTLTGPFGIIFAPVVLVGLIVTRHARRSRRAWMAIGAYCAAIFVQLAMILTNPPPKFLPGMAPRVPTLSYLHFPWKIQFLRYLALDYAMPATWTARLGAGLPYAAVSVAIGIALCMALAGRTHRMACLALGALALGLWMIGVVRTGTPQIDLKWDSYGGRYFYVPFILVTWSIIISLASTPYPSIRFASGMLLTMCLLNSVSEFQAQVWAHSGVLYREETHTWQLIVPPTPNWFVDLKPEQIGK